MIDTALVDRLQDQAHADGIAQLAVGAVICKGASVLLLKRPDDDFMGGIYELPSGKVDLDETLNNALIREVKEETGLDIATIAAYIGHFGYTSGSGNKTRQFNFAVTVAAVEPIVLTEHDTYMWANLSTPPPVTKAVQEILKTHHAPPRRRE